MSIASQCDKFTATLKRQVSVVGNEGGVKFTWSTSPRTAAGLATSIRCDMQMATAEDLREYGILAEAISWFMFCATDPLISTEDLVVWTDSSGKTRNCRVKAPSTDTRGRIWRAIVQWDKTIQ
jgi:hypothetical protein